jgi:parallel beta-helix repeat protein
MLRSFVRVSVVMIVPFLAGAVLAAEGRTPVFAPGTLLGADGKYIVTRNLIGGAGSVITIGAPNVDLDLNGFLLTGGGGGPVISVLGGVDHVTIRNGVLSGGTIGIDFPGGPVSRKIDIEDVKIHNPTTQGIHLGEVQGAALRRNEITDTGSEGILWDGPAAVKHGTIEGNLLRRTSAGIVVNNCSSVAILSNRLEEPLVGGGAFPGFGIVLGSCGGSLVSENTVERAGADGIFLRTCKGNKVFDNVVRTSAGNGIHIDGGSSDTLILNNVASGNGTGGLPTGGEGLLVEGTQNLIERNTLNSNAGFGLRFCFAGASCANTFGRNMARGNGGAALAPCAACGGVPALFPPQSCNIAGCAVPNSTYGDNLIPGPPIF